MNATQENYLNQAIHFLNEIGIQVIEKQLDDQCFLAGLNLGPNCIYLDRDKLKYPGDILHEAGHIAVIPESDRALLGSDKMDEQLLIEREIGAILWSFAACVHLGFPLDFVFHPAGYKEESDWLIESFEKKNYIGLPLMVWMGFCHSPEEVEQEGVPPFPHLLKWLL